MTLSSPLLLALSHAPLAAALLIAPYPSALSAPLRTRASSLSHSARSGPLVAALDYKDPVVATEFAAVQQQGMDEVEEELGAAGIMVPPTMNEIDARLMLVEMRLRKSGKLGSKKSAAPSKPASYANEFERAYYEKPAFKELYESYKKKGIATTINLATEYLKDARNAKLRYGGTANYDQIIAEIEEALNAKIVQEVTTPKVMFSGFPANMGEAGVRMTLAAFGEVVELSVEDSDDGLTCMGRVEFDSIESAKAAIDKYDGVDMGLGNKLQMQAL